jgi:hypothetical protein
MGKGVAKVCHPSPDNKTAQWPSHSGDADAGKESIQ